MAAMRFALLLLLLAGCATKPERWLSKDEDAAMKAQCEPNGCVCMPRDQWQGVEKILKSLGLVGI